MNFLIIFALISPAFSGQHRPGGHYLRVCLNGGKMTVANRCKGPVAAIARFEDKINTTGWSFLEIETNKSLSDEEQAYAAGVVEAQKTRTLMNYHWWNAVDGYCKGAGAYCRRLETFLDTNLNWVKKQINYYKTDEYWHQVKLALIQLAGLQDGYNHNVTKPNMNINVTHVFVFQINGEMESFEQVLNKPKHLRRRAFGSGSCSALVKGDMTSHVTWSGYNTMLRVQKLYRFYFGGKLHATLMSSYPGTLLSIDDFYVTSNKLVITETTIENSNKALWKFVKPTGTVLTWLRTITANRMAETGLGWVKAFKKYNSGTYNNQWMVVDYKVPVNATQKRFYVLEQIPGVIESIDASAILERTQGYWPSYNLPYFDEIYNNSGTLDSYQKFGDFFSYENCPRAKMFKRQHHEVRDIGTMSRMMRYNKYTEDRFAKCECDPPYSAENAISARSELNPKNGTYPFETLGHRCHGGTDMKIVNSTLVNNMQMVARVGPTNLYPRVTPTFSWTNSTCTSEQRHAGQPITFNFGDVIYKWKSGGWHGTIMH